jgi:hypothetical protein
MLSKSAFDAMLSVSVLVVVALGWGGFALLRSGEDRRRAILMLVAAAVLLGNVLIWSWPS